MADGAFHPDLASVHLDDLLNDREPEASPRDRLPRAAAHPAEPLEDVPDLVLRDADAGVADAHERKAALDPAREGDGAALGRVLDRIVDDVADDLEQAVAVGDHDRQPRVEVGL